VERVHGLGCDLEKDLSGLMREADELLRDSDAPSLKGVGADLPRLVKPPAGAPGGGERVDNLYDALLDCRDELRWKAAAGAMLLTMQRWF
jgi:hypothetical protein